MKSSTGSIDLKKLLCVTEGSSKEKSDRVSYSKETLIILSRNPPCHTRPECLSEKCLGDDGLWDPEKWHQSFERSSSSEVPPRKVLDHIDSREDSNVSLTPQRRSFHGGCHVASKEKPSTSYSRSLSTSSSKLSERGSKLSHSQDHESHSKRFHLQNGSNDWSRKDTDKKFIDKLEPAYSRKSRHSDYKRYVPPNASRKHSEPSYHDDVSSAYYEESEPEWISYGPKSQSDTIELGGFDGPSDDFSWMGGEIPMDDVPERKKKNKSESVESKQQKASVEEEQMFEALEEESGALEEEENGGLTLEAGDQERNGIKSEEKTENDIKPEENVLATEEPKTTENEPPLDSELFSAENESNKESRFSRWFSQDASSLVTDVPEYASEDKLVESLTSTLLNLKEEEPIRTAQQPSPQPSQHHSHVEVSKPSEVEAPPSTAQQASTPRSLDVHGKDAFNRLIASIRATDKVKEQMQQRNQKIQALQTMMNTNKARSSDCFSLSSIENPRDSGVKNVKSNILKLQLEKQKDAYQQKIRQIEQQNQKSSPTMFSGSDLHSLQINKGMLPSFTIQNSNSHIHDPIDERAAATASLAAKLAGKNKDDPPKLPSNPPMLDRLYSNQAPSTQHILNEQALKEKETLAKLQRLQQSNSADSTRRNPNASPNNLKSNSLLIAQMLASAGVTEEQLKQLTLEQQELVITMVQNQFTQKDIGKFMNLDIRNNVKLPESSSRSPIPSHTAGNASPFASVSKDFPKALPVVAGSTRVKSGPSVVPSSTHALSFLSDTSTALSLRSDVTATQGGLTSVYQAAQTASIPQANAHTRLLQRNLLPVQPAAIMSPVVPLVSPNITPRMLTPTLAAPPHIAPLVQTTTPLAAPPHPAVLLQLQQLYHANQLAAVQQQQQVAIAAAIQKQQLAAAQAQQHSMTSNDAAKLQQSVQNMRLGSARAGEVPGTDRVQFNNPLSQWFSSDVLRQSQFPPVSQLTGQQTMKLSNTPHGIDPVTHSTKQH